MDVDNRLVRAGAVTISYRIASFQITDFGLMRRRIS